MLPTFIYIVPVVDLHLVKKKVAIRNIKMRKFTCLLIMEFTENTVEKIYNA